MAPDGLGMCARW